MWQTAFLEFHHGNFVNDSTKIRPNKLFQILKSDIKYPADNCKNFCKMLFWQKSNKNLRPNWVAYYCKKK